MPTDRDRYRLAIGVVVPLALASALLSPALGTGYLADDVVSSLVPGMMRATGEDFADRTVGAIRGSIREGRFYPLVWLQYNAAFCLFRDVASYKWFIVIGCLADLALLMAVVRRLGGDWRSASLSATTTALLFQFRTFFDPILSFHGLLQVVTALLLGSLLALDLALRGRGRAWLAASAALYLACLLLYEVTYPLFLLHAALVASSRPGWRARILGVLPFALMAFLCASASVLVRKLHPGDSYIHAMNFGPSAVALALARQTSAAMPLSAFLADPAGLFGGLRGPSAVARWLARDDVLAVAALGTVAAAIGLRPSPGPVGGGGGRRGGWTLAALGGLLGILPGVMIAISGRYQGEVEFGKGYLPVYLQCFGVGLLSATGLRAVIARPGRARWAVAVAASAFGLVAGLTYRSNAEVAISLNAPPGTRAYNLVAAGMCGEGHFPRVNIEAALRAGLMEEIPEGATLLMTNAYLNWHDEPFGRFFYAMHLDRGSLAVRERSAGVDLPADGAFVVRDACLGRESGYVLLWRVGPDGTRSGPTRLFVRHPGVGPEGGSGRFAVVETPAGTVTPPPPTPGDELPTLRSGEGWVLCELGSEFDPDEVRVALDRRTVAASRSIAPAGGGDGGGTAGD
ncbi:hypothetical protein [Tautonia plasticadhaerens]|uniref:Glycosyltransferase RgtA/B/C/D-like domain-containing protein n=1 Tax=Tautonia plasticadhaerens TaxID=2527974 RepID=A0A518GWS5_9BACT|nr:hypothetical protein [Tautonia plasticadhaerens]QDV33033.1 hypothetical protein ElP_08750 [Tautonia plasticadhaerens]